MYSKDQPFLAAVKERRDLTTPHSDKLTQHIVLDIAGSGLAYDVGDCLAVYPSHDPHLVRQTIQAMRATGEEKIQDTRAGDTVSLLFFLSHRRTITSCTKKIVEYLLEHQTNPSKKEFIIRLLEDKDQVKLYAARDLPTLLNEHPEATIDPQEICDLLQPLLPRFYSIASSQKMAENEVHLTVGMVNGVCTTYLCNLVEPGKPSVPIYIHKHRGFTIPEDDKAPMIMIGPGTGIAPFRAFMQERLALGATGAHWLFFGERTMIGEYYYREFWEELVRNNQLKLDIAFSRDQEHKIYVQHRMIEKGKELYEWIQKGAYIYVCGDAKRMAKDVESALLQILETYGPPEAAKVTLSALRKEGRYLRDVY